MANRLEVIISANAAGLNKALGDAKKSAQEMTGELKSSATEATMALGALGAGGVFLTKSFLDAASRMEQFEATLTAVTHSSSEAKKMLGEMVQFASSTPFEVPSIVQAGVSIKSLGQDVKSVLPLAGDLAAVFGRDIPDAALALAKAMSGSQDGLQVLADSYGVSKAKLKDFGAEVDSSGAILMKTPEQIAKVKQALADLVKTQYGGAMEAQSKTLQGAFSNLSDSVGQLAASIGKELSPAAISAAKSLTEIVNKLNEMSPEMKQFIGGTAAAAGGLGTFGAALGIAIIGMGSAVTNAQVLGQTLTKWLGAARFASLTAGAAALGIFTAAALGTIKVMEAGYGYFETFADAEKQVANATEDVTARLHKLAQANLEGWAGKSGDELVRMGVSTYDVTKAIGGLDEEIARVNADEKLSSAQKAELIGKLVAQKDALRGVGQAIAEYITGTNAAVVATDAHTRSLEENLKITQALDDANAAARGAIKGAKVDEAALEVRAAQQALEEKKATNTATIADEERVTRAVIAAAEAQKQAKLVAIEAEWEAARKTPGGPPIDLQDALRKKKANAEREYTLTVEAESNRRNGVRRKEADDAAKAAKDAAKDASDAEKKRTSDLEKATSDAQKAEDDLARTDADRAEEAEQAADAQVKAVEKVTEAVRQQQQAMESPFKGPMSVEEFAKSQNDLYVNGRFGATSSAPSAPSAVPMSPEAAAAKYGEVKTAQDRFSQPVAADRFSSTPPTTSTPMASPTTPSAPASAGGDGPQTVALLQQILQAIKGGGGGDGLFFSR